ncbi:hypothetical protein JTB14_007408 [Gonioctena quinquepunctata]|nr:hypothetical protein JTB14_007408 [Gonioctena quinquepunctata]
MNCKKTYSDENLTIAIQAVRDGDLSYKKASTLYRIPRSILIARVEGWKNRAPAARNTPGRVPDLSTELEAELAYHLETLNRWGFGISRKEVLHFVGAYVKEHNIHTRFKDGIPQ